LVAHVFSRPFGTRSHDRVNPRLKPWAIVGRPLGASGFSNQVSSD
jgi:hypothetical protein